MKGEIIYQIFPDRFNKSRQNNNVEGLKEWESEVDGQCVMGGDLIGIKEKLDYLSKLGVSAIYLNPIFQANSNHKYDTVNYYNIDSSFGTLDDFRELVDSCHKKNIKVIIDGVFNHTSPDFFAFKDILENQERSKYKDWYTIFSYPVKVEIPPNYRNFGGCIDMPRLNTENVEVQKYIVDVIKYWEGMKIDGLRLDVPYYIEDSMLEKIRKSTSLYIVGEIWGCGKKFVPQYFDGVMNYSFRDLVQKAVIRQSIDASIFIDEWNFIEETYGQNIHCCFNMSGSHDTERIFNFCRGDIKREKLFYAFLFLFPGMPLVYYGDEIGMKGENDPYCRGTMEWNESKWNYDIYNHVKGLIELRNSSEALQKGTIQFVGHKEMMFAFERVYGEKRVKVFMNFGHSKQSIDGFELDGLSYKVIV
ncbi:glycoside hydrolase family 13 protein [Clostridium saccharoperbutylacetonicum]|uniref:glycoside hydrolase family 13 protein n=1 Tax=Clostridium saccharoperbutylacetonicum TaxID=36745 RepID=UPI000984046E|nr:glycoside hydrolase family 13 protein [Clostridium saccharoperbutylacetonicum]AQR97594.1 neopullulanase [Clostridium saccharoperbutylacetonicum]NSB33479.1 glycosidase [Clostridium saccharoperbutylacetonicum]